ncbi:AMIN-like domain-containing (lipo)protein [Raineyella fluvialis]|uniref:AMIN-like domain-containing protein n=1 Tax=Raineyella fluvialis TaxID=2662261 RepID=A0A5Q2F8D0_9ACTN|nr:hypothetical protein [Raineyella fluvialis]QGF23079.1 hypothetical protein Rai3103_04695 [Raineyella fluvialis]
MRSALGVIVLGTTIGVLVAGCAGGGGPAASVSASPTTSVTASSSPSTPMPTPPAEDDVTVPKDASTSRNQQEPAAGSQLVLTGVRTASHPGVDRVVFEFTGTGAPGWAVEYVDKAIAQGSGQQITVAGRSVLRVSMTGTTYPAASPAPAPVPQRVPGDGAGVVTEVVQNGTFEGDTLSFIGLSDGQRPFAVHTLQSPTRVVVDIVR